MTEQDMSKIVEALQRIADHFSSDWPERCQANVLLARAALAEHDAQPAARSPPDTIPLSEVVAEFTRDPEKKALLIAARERLAEYLARDATQQDGANPEWPQERVEAAAYSLGMRYQPAAQQEPLTDEQI